MKEKIIKTAFKEWGKLGYRNISLLLVAKKLKITKSGLYRYFKSKDDLIQDMKNKYLLDFFQTKKQFIEESENITSHEEKLKLFITKFVYLFGKFPYYIKFGFLFIDKDERKKIISNQYKTLQNREELIFKDIMSYYVNSENKYKLLYTYIFSIIFFVISTAVFKKSSHTISGGLSDDKIKENINLIFNIVNNGFGKRKILETNMSVIENQITSKINNLNKTNEMKDKIFNAISDVITEEGLWNTTVSKIAKKIGITKSSLYFYFNSKNDMINNLITSEMKNISAIISENVSDDIYSSLYSLFVTGFYYFSKNINLITIFHWISMQNKSFKHKPKTVLFKKIETHIKKAINNNVMNSYNYPAKVILFLLNSISITLIFHYKENDITNDITIDNFNNINDIRLFYKIFLFGLKGGYNEE